MKKIIFLLIILFVSFTFIISCGNYFNPRYYYNNRGSSSEGNVPDNPDLGGGGEGLAPEDDPFQTGDWNRPDYGGFTLDLDNLVIRADFDGNNRPTYRLEKGTWDPYPASNAYKNGGNLSCEAGNFSIGSVTYYLYKGKNPNYSIDSKYNQSSRLERFYFYRLKGSSAGKDVNNYLICIDKYSKLVFAFAVPMAWENVLIKYMPISWGAVESGYEIYETGGEVYFNKTDGIQYFYEYDPVGIVHEDGTIEIYQWCSDSIGNNKLYGPRVEGNKIDLSRPIASKGVAGRSPYMPIKVEATVKDNVTIMAKSFKNISARSAEGYLSWSLKPQYDDIRDYGYFTYTISASAYNSEISDGTLTDIEHLDPRDSSLTGMIYVNEVKKIDKNNYINFNSSKSFEIKNINENVCIDLASRIFKYNTLKAIGITCIDTDNFGKGGSGEVASKDMPKLKLKYDADNEQFVVDIANSVMNNDGLSTTISYYTPDFTLKRGETKDLTIRYKWMKGNDASNGEEVEVTYSLKFESVE
ncbi:hypothetical protein JQ824_01450 [Brachyspira hyodysenteriae]|uniref:Uncharacterized protein n=2 Tax=Brachyspira hyodysenteriae TaxID=159 RepID=A0A3B6V9A3_BRAHW|nr:hypothetical protein [Brachyspira hyodysenteriae]ACN83369.1 hypothetical protein BHWA1_00876 [Brachyspira hyodysenteriae WA1]ANN64489.1 hypothetical protein BHYOB78_11625 [Brachyspira hyodysenteriae ATCC 27164]AUJ49106.1 hypothetical protein BH718_00649 [Brachyspira hyodysenteriae]KLI20417.1 hypothetical protein SU46_03505 [Brachyspira hyodysenteriae]KLI27674.1 hypothetical protein SZ47_03840 [Brachyspira hyodysenteriae]